MDTVSYALSRKYVNDTINALGAVKGAPCTIKTIDEHENYTDVVFEWTGTDGSILTDTMRIDNPIKKVTSEHIKTALGYTPAKQEDVASLSDVTKYFQQMRAVLKATLINTNGGKANIVVQKDGAEASEEVAVSVTALSESSLRIECQGGAGTYSFNYIELDANL